MNVPELKAFCGRFPGAAHTLYGEPYNFLVYHVGGKKFAYFKTSVPERWRFSIRVDPDRFIELTDVPGVKAGPLSRAISLGHHRQRAAVSRRVPDRAGWVVLRQGAGFVEQDTTECHSRIACMTIQAAAPLAKCMSHRPYAARYCRR